MFTQPCFIRKNTPKLRKRLENLSYLPPSKLWYNENFAICAFWRDNNGEYLIYEIDDDFERIIAPNYPFIDCGTNEELFIALASLRDDNDYMQWFVFPKTHTKRLSGCFGQVIGMDGHYKEIVGYEWYRHENKDNALTERLNEMIQMEVEDMDFLPHKATVEEIIEHFNGK